MTGSGATCFGIYENTNNAKIAEKLLKAEFKNMWIKRTELINQF
jgi:4-diphosphocytidyl-2C-methyl-D-erythritol kinase